MIITLKQLLTNRDKAILLITFTCIITSLGITAYSSFTGYVPFHIASNMLIADAVGIAILLLGLAIQANRALKLSKK